jgi:hypothetical protein
MAFDIHRIDDIAEFEEEEIYEYDEELLNLFIESPEGQAWLAQNEGGIGFWVGRLLDYGRTYSGGVLTELNDDDMDELLTDIFPRKVSLSEPEHADEALPELITFWEYIQREYKLPNAAAILGYLRSVKPADFRAWMNDPSRFGMGKSFFMQGQAAGFDMHTEEGLENFRQQFNASSFPGPGFNFPLPPMDYLGDPYAGLPSFGSGGIGKKADPKARQRRKMARASRKKNRKRK